MNRLVVASSLSIALLVASCGEASSPSASEETASSPDGGTPPAASTPGTGAPPPTPLESGLGAYPVAASPPTRGGTMTFTNVGAAGSWARRIDRPAGDPACNVKDGTDSWGGHCCQKEQRTESRNLAPFDEETTLIVKALDLKQMAVYQPTSPDGASWGLVSAWDRRSGEGQNLAITRDREPESRLTGELHKSDCVSYLAQNQPFDCSDGRDYYCPADQGVKRLGWRGSKLFVLLASMTFDDAEVKSCSGNGQAHPGPWVALVASELIRDGGRKWNGACNCYSKTGTVGDGCGEINLFEVVMDGNAYSNREFASTGVRSYQAGHVGGNVCGTGCSRKDFPDDVEVVDACAKRAYAKGPEIAVGGASDGCPVWKRPIGDRYFVVLLDEVTRRVQVAVVHPERVPSSIATVLPALPRALPRSVIDALADLRLPSP